jgi:hypothetical protein
MELTDRLFVPRDEGARSILARVSRWLRAMSTDAAATPAPVPVYVLRWVFRRDLETVTCELKVVDDDYLELRTVPPHPVVNRGLERFTDGCQAVRRQSEVHAALVGDGWTLELHESILA